MRSQRSEEFLLHGYSGKPVIAMPEIESTSFGMIKIDGKLFDSDIVITSRGKIKKRDKELSRAKYGTSHKFSQEEAEYIWDDTAEKIIIGNGQYGKLSVTRPAKDFFKEKGVKLIIKSTPEAIKTYNESSDKKIGLFHVTC